jgi:Ca2+/H+ antiporter
MCYLLQTCLFVVPCLALLQCLPQVISWTLQCQAWEDFVTTIRLVIIANGKRRGRDMVSGISTVSILQ